MTIRRKHPKEQSRRKESRDAALSKGTEDLAAAGTDLESLEATPESVARLKTLPLPTPEAERAVACWLGFAEIPEAAAALSEMEPRARGKELKREIRRSLFRLEQRGILPPRPGGRPAETPLLAKEEDRGYLSPVDGRGDLVVWYVRPERSGDYYVLSGVLNHRQGLLESDAGHVARPALRELLEGTRRRFAVRLLMADAAWCDRILHEAYKRSGSKRSPSVARFPSFRMEISHRVPEPVPCPVHHLVEGAKEAEGGNLVDRSASLLEEPELAGWTLDPDWMAPHLEALQAILDSPLVLNRFQQEERQEKALRSALSAIFAGEAREIYRLRLEAMAYYFLLDKREEAARGALAVREALSESSPGPVETLPFVARLGGRSFAAAEEARKAREKDERRASLIVKPGER